MYKKSLYIAKYSKDYENDVVWFVADSNLSNTDELFAIAYEEIANSECLNSVKEAREYTPIIDIYEVFSDLIDEIVASKEK